MLSRLVKGKIGFLFMMTPFSLMFAMDRTVLGGDGVFVLLVVIWRVKVVRQSFVFQIHDANLIQICAKMEGKGQLRSQSQGSESSTNVGALMRKSHMQALQKLSQKLCAKAFNPERVKAHIPQFPSNKEGLFNLILEDMSKRTLSTLRQNLQQPVDRINYNILQEVNFKQTHLQNISIQKFNEKMTFYTQLNDKLGQAMDQLTEMEEEEDRISLKYH